MIATLLVFRGRVQAFFEKNYRVIRGLLKGLVVLLALLVLAQVFPQGVFVEMQWLFIIAAVICGLSPDVVSIATIMGDIVIEIWNVSYILSLTMMMILFIYLLLFGRKTKAQWYLILTIPLFSFLKMGFLVPVIAALFLGPGMIPALMMGIILRFGMEGVAEYTATARGIMTDTNPFSSLKYLIDYMASNRLLLVALIVYIATFLVIYLLRKSNFRYSPQIAILTGCIVLYTLEMISNIIWQLELDLLMTSLLVILTMVIAYIVQFFRLSLDYHGTRKLQFEDDEYFYYVTAIPKYNVAVAQNEVTKIVSETESDDDDSDDDTKNNINTEERD